MPSARSSARDDHGRPHRRRRRRQDHGRRADGGSTARPGALPVHGGQRRVEQRAAADHPARSPGQARRGARGHGRAATVPRRARQARAGPSSVDGWPTCGPSPGSRIGSPRSGTASGWPGAGSAPGEIVVFDRHYFVDFPAYDMDGEGRTWPQRVHGLVLGASTPARPRGLPRCAR